MTYNSEEEVRNLIEAFEKKTLPRSQWTHQAHLTIALWYLIRQSYPEAVQSIRQGIQCYNVAVDIQNTKDSGYHETLTLFWIQIVQRFLTGIDTQTSLESLANRLIQHYADSRLPFQYYKHDRLFSPQARTSWLDPDLKPLPQHMNYG